MSAYIPIWSRGANTVVERKDVHYYDSFAKPADYFERIIVYRTKNGKLKEATHYITCSIDHPERYQKLLAEWLQACYNAPIKSR